MVSIYLLLFIEKYFLTIRYLPEDVGPAVADELFDSIPSAGWYITSLTKSPMPGRVAHKTTTQVIANKLHRCRPWFIMRICSIP